MDSSSPLAPISGYLLLELSIGAVFPATSSGQWANLPREKTIIAFPLATSHGERWEDFPAGYNGQNLFPSGDRHGRFNYPNWPAGTGAVLMASMEPGRQSLLAAEAAQILRAPCIGASSVVVFKTDSMANAKPTEEDIRFFALESFKILEKAVGLRGAITYPDPKGEPVLVNCGKAPPFSSDVTSRIEHALMSVITSVALISKPPERLRI